MDAKLAAGEGVGLDVGRGVRVPDGRSGVVRWVYPGDFGPNLVVRTEEGTMLVLPAARCKALGNDDDG